MLSVHGNANLLPILFKEDSLTMETTVVKDNNNSEGMDWRIALSIVAFFGIVIGIAVWIFFYAQEFNIYQNIAVITVILLGFLAVMGATWASWGMREPLGPLGA